MARTQSHQQGRLPTVRVSESPLQFVGLKHDLDRKSKLPYRRHLSRNKLLNIPNYGLKDALDVITRGASVFGP